MFIDRDTQHWQPSPIELELEALDSLTKEPVDSGCSCQCEKLSVEAWWSMRILPNEGSEGIPQGNPIALTQVLRPNLDEVSRVLGGLSEEKQRWLK